TMLPRVTWPSPPMATFAPRRTERMVVPWNWGGSLMGWLLARGGSAGLPEIAFPRLGISAGLAAHQDRVAVHAHRLEERGGKLAQVGEDHALAGELDRLHDIEEGRGVVELDAQHLGHVDRDLG